MTDIVIPLSKQSQSNNIELRVALRSIQKYAKNLGNIFIYTEAELPWLRGVTVVKHGDPIPNNKDANLINKIKAASQNPDINDRFMFWSDDQLLTGELDLDAAPVIANGRGLTWFEQQRKNPNNTKWYHRMYNTLKYIEDTTGRRLDWNYDSHAPQPYTKTGCKEVFYNVPYNELPGFCINTIYYGMLGQPYNVQQQEVKVTFQGENMKIIPKKFKTYVGYDNNCWMHGMLYFFLGMFFTPSKYQGDMD